MHPGVCYGQCSLFAPRTWKKPRPNGRRQLIRINKVQRGNETAFHGVIKFASSSRVSMKINATIDASLGSSSRVCLYEDWCLFGSSSRVCLYEDWCLFASSSRVSMTNNGTPGPCTWSTEPCLCSPQPLVVAQPESGCTQPRRLHMFFSKGVIFVNHISLWFQGLSWCKVGCPSELSCDQSIFFYCLLLASV